MNKSAFLILVLYLFVRGCTTRSCKTGYVVDKSPINAYFPIGNYSATDECPTDFGEDLSCLRVELDVTAFGGMFSGTGFECVLRSSCKNLEDICEKVASQLIDQTIIRYAKETKCKIDCCHFNYCNKRTFDVWETTTVATTTTPTTTTLKTTTTTTTESPTTTTSFRTTTTTTTPLTTSATTKPTTTTTQTQQVSTAKLKLETRTKDLQQIATKATTAHPSTKVARQKADFPSHSSTPENVFGASGNITSTYASPITISSQLTFTVMLGKHYKIVCHVIPVYGNNNKYNKTVQVGIRTSLQYVPISTIWPATTTATSPFITKLVALTSSPVAPIRKAIAATKAFTTTPQVKHFSNNEATTFVSGSGELTTEARKKIKTSTGEEEERLPPEAIERMKIAFRTKTTTTTTNPPSTTTAETKPHAQIVHVYQDSSNASRIYYEKLIELARAEVRNNTDLIRVILQNLQKMAEERKKLLLQSMMTTPRPTTTTRKTTTATTTTTTTTTTTIQTTDIPKTIALVSQTTSDCSCLSCLRFQNRLCNLLIILSLLLLR